MKGILAKIKEINEPIDLKPPSKEEIIQFLEESWRLSVKREKEKNDRISKNFKELAKKAKILNKEIPDELSVIIWMDNPIGSKTYEKYKEWFE